MERARSFAEKENSKGLIRKTLERCKSLGHKRSAPRAPPVPKAKSWPRLVPEGYITVRVGPDKERFMIRTECVNHPSFKELLDEAESVFGYPREGPIELPCDVDRFDRVMWQIDERDEQAVSSSLCSFPASPRRGFAKGQAGYRGLNPYRPLVAGRI